MNNEVFNILKKVSAFKQEIEFKNFSEREATDYKTDFSFSHKVQAVDVVIICATHDEYEYFEQYILGGEILSLSNDTSYYYKGYIKKTDRDLSVVLVVPVDMGIASAAISTTKAIMQFRPKLVAMYGIIAGVGRDVNIGDIVIATKSINYNEVAEVQSNDQTVRTKYMHSTIQVSNKIKNQIYIFSKSSVSDQLSEHEELIALNRSISFHFGLVVSGGQLMRNQSRITQLQKDYHGIKGLDMETFGVYTASCNTLEKNPPLFISIKSVSDHGGNRKEKDIPDINVRRKISLFNSSIFLYELLKSDDIELL